MLNIFNYLKRPEYIFRPRQVLERIRRLGKNTPATARVILPWGAPLQVRPHDNVGSEIFHFGIFDRIVPEAIHRLADPGEILIEAGANIGQNCSLMVYKTGRGGHVIAFEPHPEIFDELRTNAMLWPERLRQTVRLENVALADTTGEAWLSDGPYFDHNRGTASLSLRDVQKPEGRKYKVAVRRLDEYLLAPMTVGVCKIDVEGHELSVLKGAEESLTRRAIRDIIFEDFSPKPSRVVEFLQKYQFTVFQMSASWWRPILTEIVPGMPLPNIPGDNYLATLDVPRLRSRFKSCGWRCLMCPPTLT